jgi:hypothetical protein
MREFTDQRSGLCLVVKGASFEYRALLIQAPCNGTTHGLWWPYKL